MSDYHLHLWPHVDEADTVTAGSIEAYVEAGAARGISEFGFTEHLYRCREAAQALGPFWEEAFAPDVAESVRSFIEADRTLSLDEYVGMVLEAKAAGLPVLLGLEVDFLPTRTEEIMELIEPYPWDYLIGSTHWVAGIPVDSPGSFEIIHRFGARSLWELYSDWIVAMCEWGHVDVLAHVDLPKKFGVRLEEEPLDLYDKIVAASVRNGMVVEISSQGLRNPAGEAYPSPNLLQRFHEAGVPIVFSSDAHEAGQVGDQGVHLRELAAIAGYSHRVRFSQRRRELVEIEDVT